MFTKQETIIIENLSDRFSNISKPKSITGNDFISFLNSHSVVSPKGFVDFMIEKNIKLGDKTSDVLKDISRYFDDQFNRQEIDPQYFSYWIGTDLNDLDKMIRKSKLKGYDKENIKKLYDSKTKKTIEFWDLSRIIDNAFNHEFFEGYISREYFNKTPITSTSERIEYEIRMMDDSPIESSGWGDEDSEDSSEEIRDSRDISDTWVDAVEEELKAIFSKEEVRSLLKIPSDFGIKVSYAEKGWFYITYYLKKKQFNRW